MHMLKPEVADKLTELLTPMEGKRILEIGTGWAESAEFFSRLKPAWKIYTIDGFGLYGDGRIYPRLEHEEVLKINKKIQRCGNVIQLLGDSSAIPWELPIDLLFIDGDHSYDGCLRDFLAFEKWVRTGGLICFDDYTQENNPLNEVKRVVDLVTITMTKRYEIIHKGYYCAILKKL
jgi:predicted O-methyltransferase YrrM